MRNRKAGFLPVVVGIVLIIVGICLDIPDGVLTTYEELDGESTELGVFDDKYSAIDEYVGGDAYNYMIGASFVSAKISAMIISKTIVIISGVLCMCFGVTMMLLSDSKKVLAKPISDEWDANAPFK